MQLRAILAVTLGCGVAAACGGTAANPPGSGGGGHGGGGGGGDAPLAAGVYAIPLSTPDNADQGSFYTPTVTASGGTFLLDLDTGSTVTGIAGTTCATCTGLSPLYTPGASAMPTGGSDMATYADGSMWSGDIYADDLSLANGTQAVSVDFVDIDSQVSFFTFSGSNEYQGILGMGPDALLDPGTTAYFDQEVAKGVTNTMAFELCPSDGTMWLGGYDPSHAGSDMQFTPILGSGDNAGFYSVDMESISLGDTSLGATSATLDGPIVDTGTSLFYIPSAAETALIADLNKNSKFRALFPGQTLTDPTNSDSETAGCVDAGSNVTDAEVDSDLPPLTMTFAGVSSGTITLSSPALASYFIDYGSGQYCLVIYGGGDEGAATMGDTFMRGFVTVIDRTNDQVGFAPTVYCAAPDVVEPRARIRERGRGPNHGRASHTR